MTSHKVYFEPSIVAVCSWLRANYEHHHSGSVSKESIWRYFMNEHKRKGFSVNDSRFSEFLGYVGEYITKSTLMQNVVVDKSNKRYVNLQQKRSGPPEECGILDTLIRYWLVHSYEEAAEGHDMHVIKIYADFCTVFGLDSYDRYVEGSIYTTIISNIGDLIENGVFTKVKPVKRIVCGLVKSKKPSGKFNNVNLQCSSSGFVKVTWKIHFNELSHELSMTRPAGRILFPLVKSFSSEFKRVNDEHEVSSTSSMSYSSTAGSSSSSRERDRGGYKASVRSTMNYLQYLSDAREEEENLYHHQQMPPVLLSPSHTKKLKVEPFSEGDPVSTNTRTAHDMLDADLVCKDEPLETDDSSKPSHLINATSTTATPTLSYNSHCLSSVLLQCQLDIQPSSNPQQVNPQTGHWEFCTSLGEFLSQFSQGIPSTASLIVTDVMRFIPDWSFDPDVCGPIDESCPEAFDLVVFDGCGYIKIVLHTSCNFLVQKHTLYSTSYITMSELTLTSKDNRPVIVAGYVDVLEIALTAQQLDFIAKVREMPHYKMTVMKPALTYREYYVSMWTNEDPLEPGYWSSLCTGREIKPCNMDLLSNIAKILEKFDSEHGSETLHCTIAGRIFAKSRMIHFAKVVSSMTTSFPFQFYVEIADATDRVILVFWGLNALQWFDQIEVGDVIAAESFTVRKVNPNLQQDWGCLSRKNRGVQKLEFSLSYSSPLRKITAKREIESLHLPSVTHNFVNHSDLSKSPDDTIFDVFGIIIFASRIERMKRKVRRPAASTEIQTPDINACIYWQYRWIGLVDGSSFQPYFLKLFTCCQQEFHHLQPGQVMVCTNVAVRSDAVTSRKPRNVYVTSTVESQFYILSDVTSFGGTAVEREPLLYRTVSISQLGEIEPLLLASIVGGYMVTPYDFSNFSKCNNEDDDNNLQVVKGEELNQLCDALCHQESRRVLINAEVVRVEFVKMFEEPCTDIIKKESEDPTGSCNDIIDLENHHVVENTDRMEEFANVDCVGIEYLDPSVMWEPFTENVADPNHILPNNTGYWILSLLTDDLKITVNVFHLLINKDHWLFPHLKEQKPSPFEKLLEMPVCDEEMIKRKLELVSQNLFDRNMSFVLQLYSLGGDNTEIIVQGAELSSTS